MFDRGLDSSSFRSQIHHLINDALHAVPGDLSHIVGGGDIACGSPVAGLARVGGHRLIGRRRQGVAHKVRPRHLPVHAGQLQRHAVLDRCGGDIGHIVPVHRADGLGGRHSAAPGLIAGRLRADAGVVQGQGPLVHAVVVVDRGLQLVKNLGEVVGARLHRHGFPVVEHVGHMVVLLDDIREGVEVTLLFKGFLDQPLRVRVRGQHIGLDELLAAVEVLDHGVRGHLQGGGAGGQRERQQQAQEDSLHYVLDLLLHKNTMPAIASMAARAALRVCFMTCVPPLRYILPRVPGGPGATTIASKSVPAPA